MFGKIPGIIKSMFSGAVGIAADLGREIANWLNANTVFGDDVNVGPVHLKIPALATGGTMAQTGAALVGEKGPELVTLPGGATVTPLPAVTTMGATITVPVYLDRRQIALATGEWYADQAARKGKAP
jgi:phage-related minor tail protein